MMLSDSQMSFIAVKNKNCLLVSLRDSETFKVNSFHFPYMTAGWELSGLKPWLGKIFDPLDRPP